MMFKCVETTRSKPRHLICCIRRTVTDLEDIDNAVLKQHSPSAHPDIATDRFLEHK